MNLFKRKDKIPPREKTEEEKQKDAARKAILSKIGKIIIELLAVLSVVIAWTLAKHGAILGMAGLISVIRMTREDSNWMIFILSKILNITEADNNDKQKKKKKE